MKRVIDGMTFNTATAAVIALAEENEEFDDATGAPPKKVQVVLYQTRGGAFFLHVHTEAKRRNSEGQWRDSLHDEFDPLTASEARHWVANSGYQVEVISDIFGEPPEAAVEESPGATLYIRLPAPLKDRIEAAASQEKLSVNTWVMRCTERCLASRNAGNTPGGLAPIGGARSSRGGRSAP